jgi:hypothetical protein
VTINPRLIKASLEAIEPNADAVVGHFYAVLFLIDPAGNSSRSAGSIRNRTA